MIDPMQALVKTSSILVPTSSKPAFTPLPTVTPGPSIVVQEAGEVGMRTLWVVTVLMLISSLTFAFMAYRTPVQKRLYHIITTFITTFAFISYMAMATGDGISYHTTVIKHENSKTGVDTYTHVNRQVFWARYVDWSATTPLLLLDLAFLAGMNGANILVAVVADIVMILTGLFAAFGRDDGQKWGYYTVACVAYLVVVYQLAIAGRRNAMAKDAKVAKFFGLIGGLTLLLWTAYPIVWGIGDGARKMSVDAEIVAYAVLDVLAKGGFGFLLLITHSQLPAMNINLDGAWSHGYASEGTLRVGDEED